MSKLTESEMRALHFLIDKMGPKETVIAMIGHYIALEARTAHHEEWSQLADNYRDVLGAAQVCERLVKP